MLANTGVSMSQGLTMAMVSNDNVTGTPNGAGGGDYPQQSVVGWQTSTTIKVLNFDLSTTGVGTAIDFINSIWVELRVFPS